MADTYDTIFGGAEYDPCAALSVLRPAYMRLLAGASEQKITFRDRDTWFFQAKIGELKALVDQLEADCAAKRGVVNAGRRRCIVVGARRG